MSIWTERWREFIKETSYLHILKEKKVSNDQFWRSFEVYDQIIKYSGYPGEILTRISSYIREEDIFLDVGAGTGAFAIPISRKAKKVIALDPSQYQLEVLKEKSATQGVKNIEVIKKGWKETGPSELGPVDLSLAAYSFFEEDIESFLQKMLDFSRRGTFIVFKGGSTDPLRDFVYGKRASADHLCLLNILEDMGYNFDSEIFRRDYIIPINLALKPYRFSGKAPEEVVEYLRSEGRLEERDGCTWASFSEEDALLSLII
jgi:SAM-dependent methyltransferase